MFLVQTQIKSLGYSFAALKLPQTTKTVIIGYIQGINGNYPGKFDLVESTILNIFLSKFTIT